MKNLGEQLELDFGMLTNDQQVMVDEFIDSERRGSDRFKLNCDIKKRLLIEAGFIEGVDFVDNSKIITVTEERDFGWRYDRFKADVTFLRCKGGVSLIIKEFDDDKNEIVDVTRSVTLEGDKLECYSITKQFRAYKPTSLLKKLKDYNESEGFKMERANKEKSLIEHTVNKYKELFPSSEIKVRREWSRHSHNSFPVISVTFESGSFVELRLGSEIDKEYISKKVDKVINKLSVVEVMDVFNKQ